VKYGREEEELREGGENKGEMRYKTEGSGEISDEGERRRIREMRGERGGGD